MIDSGLVMIFRVKATGTEGHGPQRIRMNQLLTYNLCLLEPSLKITIKLKFKIISHLHSNKIMKSLKINLDRNMQDLYKGIFNLY